MEVTFQDLETLIRSSIVPHVLVVTTPEVEEACLKNRCQFIDLLHPFSTLDASVSVRGVKEEPYMIHDFRIRFLEPSELRLTHELEESIEQQLHDQVRESSRINQRNRYNTDCKVTNLGEATTFLSSCKQIEQKQYVMPWYHHYQNKFLQNIGVSEHEFFCHPVACIFVVSSHEDISVDDTPESFIKIADSVLQMPGLFKEGFMDTHFLRYYVLLKDSHSEKDNKRAESKLALLHKQFGANTCMLTINSLPLDRPGENNTYLSNEDRTSFQMFVRDFISKFVIPHIEQKGQSLDEIVASNRKGLFGSRFKNLFRGFGSGQKAKPAEVPEISSYGAKIYPLSHPVAQMRQLADFVFFLRDYDNAIVNYKNCLTDFRNDKSTKHWAGCLEMISICNTLLDIQRKESENELEKVLSSYFGENHFRFATRVTFILVTMKKSRNRYLEAAAVCTRPENNRPMNPLLSALFQEQAAFCYLYKQPFPMYRMFTMRLVIASDKYYQSGQFEHALGCSFAAYPNYQEKEWYLINSHLQYGIGRESYLLSDLNLSIDHFQQLILQRNPYLRFNPEVQSTYLREFLHVLKTASENSNIIRDVPIPVIKKGSVQVSLNSHYSSQGVWKHMEDWLVYEDAREKAREGFKNFSIPNTNYTKHHASVVSERIYIWCEIENPLEIPLQLYSAQIVCDHYDPSDEISDSGVPAVLEQKPDFVLVEPKDIYMQPNTVYKLSLCIQPTKIGLLEIRSIAFNLSGIVWGKVNFPIKTKKLQRTKEQRVNNAIEIDYSLCIQVVSPMPLLEISFPSIGQNLFHGEVKKFKISFKNEGEVALTNLKVKMSHPSFFVFGPTEYLENPFPTYASNEDALMSRIEIDSTYDLSLVHLPIGVLNPKSSVDLILWVRGASVGSVISKFLFYYEPVNMDQFSEMKYRVHKETAQFNVLPLFRSSLIVNPSLKNNNSYILGVNLQNIQSNMTVEVTQISSVSCSWQIQPLHSPHSSTQMQGLESIAIYSQVCSTTTHPLVLLHTNQRLGNSKTGIVDSSAIPNYQFLVRARRPNCLPLNTNFTYLNDDPPIPISSLVNPLDSDFLLFWQTNTGLHGFFDIQDVVFVPIPPPLPPAPRSRHKASRLALELKQSLKSKARLTLVPSQMAQKYGISVRNPFRYVIDSPPFVQHNFADNFFCIVPIKICIYNPYVHPITFKIEHVDEKSIKSQSDPVSSGKSPFFWVGVTSQTVQSLEPANEKIIAVQVGFISPGIYNLNRLRFSVFSNTHNEGDPEAKHIFYPFEHLITIKDSELM